MNQIRRLLAWFTGEIETEKIKKECSTCTEWKRYPPEYDYGCARKRIPHQENADECEFYSYMYQWALDEERKEKKKKKKES